MEKINNQDSYLNQIRPGTTWVAGFTQPGNNDDLRSIDSDSTEMRLIPASRYYASCTIKRGQAVSIAQLTNLTDEQRQNKYAYVKPTDPDFDETCIGIAMNYAEEGQVVQIQSTGKFNFYTTESILYSVPGANEKEIFLNKDHWSFSEVRGQKLYVKKLYGGKPTPDSETTKELEEGDNFRTDHADTQDDADTTSWFTYDLQASAYTTKNTIQIGYLTDAPTTNLARFYRGENNTWYQQIVSTDTGEAKSIPVLEKPCVIVKYDEDEKKIVTVEDVNIPSTGLSVNAGDTPPKAHEATWMQFAETIEGVDYYIAVDDLIVTVELSVTGDTRGPIDSTQFIMTLGEDIYFDIQTEDSADLKSPHFNEGIYDELKVVAIAGGNPSGPCFKFFIAANDQVGYKLAETFEAGKKYYKLLPGNIFEAVDNLKEYEFEKTYVRAYAFQEGVQYYTKNKDTGEFEELDPEFSNASAFENISDEKYYKQSYYVTTNELDNAFIALRKVDGDTYIIPVLCNFTEAELDDLVFADAQDEGYLRLSKDFTVGTPAPCVDDGVEVVRQPKITVGKPISSLSKDSLKEAIEESLSALFLGVHPDTGEKSCTVNFTDIGDDGFQVQTVEHGGSYEAYVSSSLTSLISLTQVQQGQLAKPGTAILADIRDSNRLNIVGIVLANKSGVMHKGETVRVMKMGRIVTKGNLLPGEEYYLGLNGRLTAKAQYWYDNIVTIGLAESAHYFLVNADNQPRKHYSGNFPLGYIKPSIYGMSEKGFAIADGKTVYNKDEYPELYNMLLNWFDPEELKPSNVSYDAYNRYEKWTLAQVFTDIFNTLTKLETNQLGEDEVTKILALKELLDGLGENVTSVVAQLDHVTGIANNAAATVENLKIETEASVKTFDETLNTMDTEFTERVTNFEARVTNVEGLADRVTSNEESIANLSDQLTETQASVEALQSNVQELEAADAETNSKLASFISQHEADLTEIKTATSNEIDSKLANTKTTISNEIAQVRYNIGELDVNIKQVNDKATSKISTIEATIESLNDQLQAIVKELKDQLQTDIEDLKAHTEQLQIGVADNGTRITNLQDKVTELEDLDEAVTVLTASVEQITEDLAVALDDLEEELTKKDERIEYLEQQVGLQQQQIEQILKILSSPNYPDSSFDSDSSSSF